MEKASVTRRAAPKPKAPRASYRHLEDPIHILCFNWLRTNVDGIVYHVPNGFFGGKDRVRAAITWKRLKSLGARAGVLDLTIHWCDRHGFGATAYLEVKSEDGHTTDDQDEFIAELDRVKIPFAVIRSLEDCRRAVEEMGIRVRRFNVGQKL